MSKRSMLPIAVLVVLIGVLAALAGRYDGNPEVAFVDVGSLGVWGEGRTWASTKRPILPETGPPTLEVAQ